MSEAGERTFRCHKPAYKCTKNTGERRDPTEFGWRKISVRLWNVLYPGPSREPEGGRLRLPERGGGLEAALARKFSIPVGGQYKWGWAETRILEKKYWSPECDVEFFMWKRLYRSERRGLGSRRVESII